MSAVAKIHQSGDDDDALGLDRLDAMSAAELRVEMARRIGLSVRSLLVAAACWVRLERMGEDMSGLRDGFTRYLPRIAAGVVSAELVVAFARTPSLLKKLAALSPADQKRVTDGDPLLFVVKPGETRMLPVRCLSARQAEQVIDHADGVATVRGESAQIAYLSRQAAPAWRPGKPVTVGNVTVDRAKGVVRIGRGEAAAADVIAALRKQGYQV